MNGFTINFSIDSRKPDFNDFFERLKRENLGSIMTAEVHERVRNQIDSYFCEMISEGYIEETLGKSLAKFFRQNVRIS